MRFAIQHTVIACLLMLAGSILAGNPPELDILSAKNVRVEFEGWFQDEKDSTHTIHALGQSNAVDFVDALRKFFINQDVRRDQHPPQEPVNTSEVIKLNITSEGKATYVLLFDTDLITFGKDSHYKALNTKAGTNTDFYEQILLKFPSAWKTLAQ